MHRGRGSRQFLSEYHYRIHRSSNNVTGSIPCHMAERLFSKENSLSVTLRPSPEPSSAPFYRSGPSPRPPCSDDDERPPTYQDVMHGRVESYIVDPEISPLKDGAVAAEPTKSYLPDPVAICGK